MQGVRVRMLLSPAGRTVLSGQYTTKQVLFSRGKRAGCPGCFDAECSEKGRAGGPAGIMPVRPAGQAVCLHRD